MTSNRFLTVLSSGIKSLVTAISASAGAADANKIIATDSSGRIDSTLMPVGVGLNTVSIQAVENLAAGDFGNIHDVTGSQRVRKADASNARFANCFVLSAVTSGQNATCYLQGLNTALSGMTTGQIRFLSATTAGGHSATPPATANQIIQELGTAISPTSLNFEFNDYIQIG